MPAEDATANLVVRAQGGDADAFSALARGYLRPAYAVALSVVGRPADAEDVAQDAFVLALERISTCREPGKFAGWLLTIVRNQARNWLDSRKLRDVSADPQLAEQGADAIFTDEPLRRRLVRLLAALPQVQREVVLLHDLEGWTHPEIGDALAITEVASRQHLFQARRALRTQLGGQDSEGGAT